MRDLDQWKDKVEVTLDGRQLFFLFFGGAVIASMMFCLGVMTGRRLEARALALSPPPVDDPLAALDQLGDVEDENLTFHKSLTGPSGKGKTSTSTSTSAPAQSPATPLTSSPVANANANASATPAKPTPAKPAPAAPPTTPPPSTPGHFTLQLSAFAERSDADDFMKKLQTQGYRPFVVASEIPGRGVFYRVRLGDYTNRDAATDAKTELEKKQSLVAYVTKL